MRKSRFELLEKRLRIATEEEAINKTVRMMKQLRLPDCIIEDFKMKGGKLNE